VLYVAPKYVLVKRIRPVMTTPKTTILCLLGTSWVAMTMTMTMMH
jgi:hypothetical protein